MGLWWCRSRRGFRPPSGIVVHSYGGGRVSFVDDDEGGDGENNSLEDPADADAAVFAVGGADFLESARRAVFEDDVSDSDPGFVARCR